MPSSVPTVLYSLKKQWEKNASLTVVGKIRLLPQENLSSKFVKIGNDDNRIVCYNRDDWKGDYHMKKVIPVIIAVILILVIAFVAFGDKILDKYTYSKEQADLQEYFSVYDDKEAAIILQDSMIEEKAVIKDGVCYFDLNLVHKYLNTRFYADMAENWMIYTTPTEIIRTQMGSSSYTVTVYDGTQTEQEAGYVLSYTEGSGEETVVYVAADFVRQYTNYNYEVFENPNHVQLTTQWSETTVADLKKGTALRVLGGIKSPILKELEAGSTVTVISRMDTWSEVKTQDSYIGYIENKYLDNIRQETPEPDTHYAEPEYTSLTRDYKISMGWYVGNSASLEELTASAKGLNTIAPVWFSLKNNEGGIRSVADASFVNRAHQKGLEVWGVVDDFNYAADNGIAVDVHEVLSVSSKREALISNIISEARACGMDGINIDFEKIGADTGEHFIQFLRELSIQCRGYGLVLSVDNYVPLGFNNYYNRGEQGVVADYVVVMGYDEHWSGCGEAGSVASIDYVSNGIDKTLEEVPAEKIINALPFYTRVWMTEGATVTDQSLTMKNTADYISRNNIQAEWDEETCQNYAEWESGGVTYQVWFEDVKSIGAKLNVMQARNIGGVAVWRLGYEQPAVWELISAYSAR